MSPPPNSSRSRGGRSMTASFPATMSIRARRRFLRISSRNLEAPHALGMTTVLVVPAAPAKSFARSGSLRAAMRPHVDHVTDDLAGFLRGIAERPKTG